MALKERVSNQAYMHEQIGREANRVANKDQQLRHVHSMQEKRREYLRNKSKRLRDKAKRLSSLNKSMTTKTLKMEEKRGRRVFKWNKFQSRRTVFRKYRHDYRTARREDQLDVFVHIHDACLDDFE